MIGGYVIDWVAIAAFLAAFAAMYGTWKSTQSSRRNERLTMELKILEFRHEWISKLRTEMTMFHSGLMAVTAVKGKGFSVQDHKKHAAHGKTIQLLMNPDDEDYDNLVTLMTEMTQAMYDETKSREEITNSFSRFTDLCQDVLKREWERLKSDKEKLL